MKPVNLPISKERPPTTPTAVGLPLLRLGFRPFYIGGALLAALIVPLWVAIYLGQLQWTPAAPALLWHAHEMLFGFAVAIIVGFLLTAGQAWTGLATPRGPWLGALALLWLAARVASVTGPYLLYALLDLALLPVVAVVLTRLLLRSRNHRNLPLALILVLLAATNLLFHLALAQRLALSPMTPLYATLALIVLMECVMAGRVIPAFTMTVTPGLKLNASPGWERLTLGMTGIGLLLWVFGVAGALAALTLALASVLQVRRMLGWRPDVTLRRPVLWILHAAYGWIPVGLALLAAAQLGFISASVGVHALAVGATGGLIIGMITRTARGHTGRALQASRLEIVAYALVLTSTVLRVFVPLLAPQLLVAALIAAALAWSAAFVIYLWIFTPWLLRARLDGKDG